jgi:glycosyltransferase involved in cell wall biosynthesis
MRPGADIFSATTPSPTRPIRVLYVNYISTRAGCVRSLRLLIESFPPGAVEPWVLSPPGPADEEFRAVGARVLPIPAVSVFQNIAGIPVRGIRWGTLLRTFWHMRYGGVVRHALRTVKPDLLHLNDHGMYQVASLGREQGIPVLMHVRCIADRESRWQRALLESCARRFIDEVVAIDESVRWSIREIDPCRVIYNPSPRLVPVPAPPRPPGGPVHVAFLAGLEPFKGVGDLLEAAGFLRGRKDILFQLYGGNRWPDAFYGSTAGRISGALGVARDMRRVWQARIERDGLQSSVRLMGFVPAEEALSGQTDILVFPSRLNGVGRSVFEAGILGIPSVVSLKDRIEDIVQDGVTGLIVPERDGPALAQAIQRLADDPDLRLRLGRNARNRYLGQFDSRMIGAKMLDVYRHLIQRESPVETADRPKI